MAMAKLDDTPAIHGLLDNITRMRLKNRTGFARQIISQVVEDIYRPFLAPGPAEHVEPADHDDMKN